MTKGVVSGPLVLGVVVGVALTVFVRTVARYSMSGPHKAAVIQAVATAAMAVLLAVDVVHHIALR